MKINRTIINKYTLPLFILLLCLFTDIVLHKGMSMVILSKSFTDKSRPQKFSRCEQPLINNGKKWVKAVNTLQRIKQLNTDAPGFEMDVYFDTAKNYLEVYHDSSEQGYPKIEQILKVYKERKLSCSIWLDFKNLSAQNEKKSLDTFAAVLRCKIQNCSGVKYSNTVNVVDGKSIDFTKTLVYLALTGIDRH